MPSSQPISQNIRLADAIRVVRQRIVADRWLSAWVVCCNLLLAITLIAVGFLRSVRAPLFFIAVLAVVAAAGAALFVWRRRPSPYVLMQLLDAKSHLDDRLSTAVYFWDAATPDEMVLRQREDALTRLASLQPHELFPIHAPAKMWRTWALLAALVAMCVFHARYGPPIVALKTKIVQSRTMAAVLSPFTRALDTARTAEQEISQLIDRTLNERDSNGGHEPGMVAGSEAAANARPVSPAPSPIPAPTAPSNGTGQNPPGAVPSMPAGAAGQTPGQSGQAASGDEHSAQNASSGQASMARRALQALQSLMDGALGKESSGSPQSTPQTSQDAGTTGTPMASGSSQTPATAAAQAAQGQTANSQDANSATGKSPGKHTGAGNGTHPWEDSQAHDPELAANAAKEHVMLQANGFRGPPGKERADVEAGTAQIPMQDIAPQAVATVSGSGQDSVPSRYRQYVQDYFQRNGK